MSDKRSFDIVNADKTGDGVDDKKPPAVSMLFKDQLILQHLVSGGYLTTTELGRLLLLASKNHCMDRGEIFTHLCVSLWKNSFPRVQQVSGFD